MLSSLEKESQKSFYWHHRSVHTSGKLLTVISKTKKKYSGIYALKPKPKTNIWPWLAEPSLHDTPFLKHSVNSRNMWACPCPKEPVQKSIRPQRISSRSTDMDMLNKVAKLHFKNTQKAKEILD
jgi:hypothetical protein